ncbi:MAG: DUF3883 domain-containing protein [Bacteroidetes bacterium]|nr:MAG: DUF3883 domain-containing protein [Bacteroidota bacterium]
MVEKEDKISEILNLIGYGLAKFDLQFTNEFEYKTKTSFSQFVVDIGLANSIKAVSNRQDTFDPYFDNVRKGWWQRNQRKHIKLFIDNLFGNENAKEFANIVKFYIKDFNSDVNLNIETISPVTKSKFKQMQETGNEAEYYFMSNYNEIEIFKGGIIEDARLWGDGYDFQINLNSIYLLAEVKGLKDAQGSIRITENEFKKANEVKADYHIIVISNLVKSPKMTLISNPLQELNFELTERTTTQKTYSTKSFKW